MIDPDRLPAKAVEAAAGADITLFHDAARKAVAAFLSALLEDDEAMERLARYPQGDALSDAEWGSLALLAVVQEVDLGD